MAQGIRIKDIGTTATTEAADDYYVMDGATNGTRKIAKANAGASAISTHNNSQTAHGFGVYTVAQLDAFTDADRPTGCVYCSDCLVPEGVGSPVVWTGSAWVCTCAGIQATTDLLTFFRGMRNSGRDIFAAETSASRVASVPYGWSPAASGTGASRGMNFTDGETMQYYTGTTTTGYSLSSSAFTHAAGFSAALRPVAAMYFAAAVAQEAASDGTETFVLRGITLTTSAAAGNTLGASEVGLFSDPQNQFGLGNTGNISNWLAVCRSASVSTVQDTGVGVALQSGGLQLLELLATASSVKFYAGGSLVTEITTNIPAAGIRPSIGIIKFAGSTQRSIAVGNPYSGVRYT